MESREAWKALQGHLAAARSRLESRDYDAALESVRAALVIDPAFLAAHSLRQRIELDRAAAAGAAPPSTVGPPFSRRRFGTVLADVYEQQRTETTRARRAVELPPPPEYTPAKPSASALLLPVEVRREDTLATTDTFRSSPDVRPDFIDLRLNGREETDDLDAHRAHAHVRRSRGPHVVFIGATVLVAVILGERQRPFPPVVSPSSESTEPSLLAATPLRPVSVPSIAGSRSMNTVRTRDTTAAGSAASTGAPRIRSVAESPLAAGDAAPSATATAASAVNADLDPSRSEIPTADAGATARQPDPVTAVASPPPDSGTYGAPPTTSVSAVDEQSVKLALQRYQSAYERLDAKQARAVWPSVNESALARAFDSLQSQTLTFTACDVNFRGPAAVATCEGSTRYTPRYGSRQPRVEPRIWTFTLRKRGADWKIDSVKAER